MKSLFLVKHIMVFYFKLRSKPSKSSKSSKPSKPSKPSKLSKPKNVTILKMIKDDILNSSDISDSSDNEFVKIKDIPQ